MAAVDHLTRLARLAQAGDTRALGSFVGAAYEPVWRLCAGIAGAQSADDLSQEAFIRAVRSLPQFRSESSALTWLLAIARHVCLDELRGRARRDRADVLLARHPQAAVPDPSAALALADLVGRLDTDRRAAFVLTQVLGLSYAEAAEICDCPTGTIRSRVARARSELVQLFQQPGREHLARGSPGS